MAGAGSGTMSPGGASGSTGVVPALRLRTLTTAWRLASDTASSRDTPWNSGSIQLVLLEKVVEVIGQEQLVERAKVLGKSLLDGLQELQKQYSGLVNSESEQPELMFSH